MTRPSVQVHMTCRIGLFPAHYTLSLYMLMMMMVLCSKACTPPGNEMSEVVSRCLPHRQLWVSNLSKVAMQWLEVDSNLRPSGCKAHNIPLVPTLPRPIHVSTYMLPYKYLNTIQYNSIVINGSRWYDWIRVLNGELVLLQVEVERLVPLDGLVN